MARDPRRCLLGRDRDILLRDRDETLVRLETVSRLRRLDRDQIPGIHLLKSGPIGIEAFIGEDFIFDALLYAEKLVASFYKVQCANIHV